MAKKYLLYIHDDEEFDKVENKSQLINQLLETHYWKDLAKTIPKEAPPRSYKPKWAKDKVITIDSKATGPITLTVPIDNIENGVCRVHGTPLDNRGKCLQKGCKFA